MDYREIERKFLVAGDFRGEVSGASHIVQGYLSTTPGRSVRVRLRDEQGWITVKGPMRGLTRIEWEKEIPAGEAQLLLSLCEPGVIDKTRHLVAGLLVAEVELGSEDEAFCRPAWLGEEVTGDRRYYNSSLTKRPYKDWKEEQL